jgi:hypothetical protein
MARVGKRTTNETGASAGVCVWYTQIQLLCFTHRWGSRESVSSAVRVLDFTYTLGVVFYNRGDQSGF